MSTHEDKTVAFFAADYRPDFGPRLARVTDALYGKYQPDDVAFAPSVTYILKWTGKRKLMVVGTTRFACQTLGLDVWQNEFEQFSDAIVESLALVEADNLKRIGFKLISFHPQNMSHAELSNLLFGTLLRPADEWQPICDSPADPLVHLSGERDGMKIILETTAMNQEQIAKTVTALPYIDHFSKARSIDPTVSSFAAKLSAVTSLMIDVDLFRENVPVSDTRSFLTQSLKSAQNIIDGCVMTILSKENR